MSQFFNSLQQIKRSESVGTFRGIYRHIQWQFRREFHGFPCELQIGNSTLYVERPNGVAALVNAMGEYDYNNMNFLRLLLSNEKGAFFDIGANIGSYTLIASEIPNATVVSFEPHPGTFALLRQNVERNRRSNVLCLNVALSDHAGEVQFTDGPESSINRVVEEPDAKSAPLRVPARRLDSVCEELHLTPDFVKIDVEGYEDAVLRGCGKFAGLAKVIFVEGGERREVQRWMEAAGYCGPLYCHFKKRLLSAEKQKRPEDPMIIHRSFLPELQRMGFGVSEDVDRGLKGKFQTAVSSSAQEKKTIVGPRGSCGAVGSRPRKTVVLTNIIPPYWVATFEKLRRHLSAFQIFLSTPMEPNRDWKPDWGDLPVTIQKCWTYRTRWRHRHGFSETIWRHIPYDTLSRLIRERPDVVLSGQLGMRTLQAAIYRRLFPQTRLIICTALSEVSEKGLSRFRVLFRRILLRTADAVTANGSSATRYLLSLRVPRERIFVVPSGTEIARLLDLPLEREPTIARRFLYVGQLIERKGLALFLAVLSNWLQKHPGVRCEFWIAGDGPLRGKLEKFPAPPQLQLCFLGSIPFESLPEIYAQGGIFVFPTLSDEWGVVVNEAMAAGLPVLGSLYSQAAEELVEDDVHGWTFRPDHPEEMYASLSRAMAVRDEQLGNMRRACRRRVASRTPDHGASCFLAAIDYAHSSLEKG